MLNTWLRNNSNSTLISKSLSDYNKLKRFLRILPLVLTKLRLPITLEAPITVKPEQTALSLERYLKTSSGKRL